MRTLVPALFLAATAPLATAQDCTGWAAIGDPCPRLGAIMTTDTARGVAVLFGGARDVNTSGAAGAFSSETWEHDGRRWYFRTLDGPTPRYGAHLSYNPARQRTVLVGGFFCNAVGANTAADRRRTWEWDGSAWTPGAETPLEFGTSGALDYVPGVGTLFIRPRATAGPSEVYQWDGAAWSLRATGPMLGGDVTSAFDPARNALVVCSTMGTYAYDGAAFTQLLASDTSAPSSLRYVPARGAVVGFRAASPSSLVELGAQGWTAVTTLPSGMLTTANGLHQATATLPDGRLFVMGGTASNLPRVNSWTLTGAAFTGIARRGPMGTEGPAMAFDPLRGVSVATGGMPGPTGAPTYDTDVWELRGETWKLRGNFAGAGRQYASMAFDLSRNAIILAGGNQGNANTYTYDGQTWTQLPSGVSGIGSLDWDGANNRLVYIDSAGSQRWLNGTTWTSATSLNITNATVRFEPVRNQLIAAGSNSAAGSYRFTGSAWPQFINVHQTSRYSPLLAYYAPLGGLILFGGFNSLNDAESNLPNRTYFLGSQATAWTTLNERGPFGRKFSGVATDTLSDRIVINGGYSLNPAVGVRDTWKFATGPAAIAVQPTDSTARAGAAAELFLVAKGGGVLSYQWRKNGQPLQDGPRFDGARTDTLLISALEAADNAVYDCVVSNACATDTSAAARLSVACLSDFNGDGDVGTDQDIEAFFACLGGNCCANCGTADFNGDGDFGTDQDIESFFRVLGGGTC